MIDGGFMMIMIGVLVMFVPPTHRIVSHRRAVRVLPYAAALQQAFPAAAPTPSLSRLVNEAEAALESDALLRGVRGLTTTYDQA